MMCSLSGMPASVSCRSHASAAFRSRNGRLRRSSPDQIERVDQCYLEASSIGEFDAVFARLVHERINGLIIANEAFFFSEIAGLASLVSRHAVPAIGPLRGLRNPTTGSAGCGCCARAVTGQTDALPSPAINSRRLIIE